MEFSFQNVSGIVLIVASSAMAFAPFSQYSNGDLCFGSGQAQPGQSNPFVWLALLNDTAEPTSPIFETPCFHADITAGIPPAVSSTEVIVGVL